MKPNSKKDVNNPQAEPPAILEFRLAKAYWLAIQPYTAGRRLTGAEFFIAEHAWQRLQSTRADAIEWNNANAGTQDTVLAREFAELAHDLFRKPEELTRDERLTPEILAAIAAPLTKKRPRGLTPEGAVRAACDLFWAAEKFLATLPERKKGNERIVQCFTDAFSHVTFEQIQMSNQSDSGVMPLLPPVQRGRNKGELSLPAIKTAVENYLRNELLSLTKEEYEREQRQDNRLFNKRDAKTYEEWQSGENQRIIECITNSRVPAKELCELRWQRFRAFWQHQQRRTSSRGATRTKSDTGQESNAG